MEECGERLRTVLESPSVPPTNHQLLVHLSRHLARLSQHGQTSPRQLGQAFADAVFKQPPLRYALLFSPALIRMFRYLNIPSLMLWVHVCCCSHNSLFILSHSYQV